MLVLDGVWNERRDYWEMFRLPMLTTKLCKIIVTTRSQNVARLVQTMDSCELSCLDSNDSWSLFKQTALLDEEHANNPSLQEIGKDIVSRCKGCRWQSRLLEACCATNQMKLSGRIS